MYITISILNSPRSPRKLILHPLIHTYEKAGCHSAGFHSGTIFCGLSKPEHRGGILTAEGMKYLTNDQ